MREASPARSPPPSGRSAGSLATVNVDVECPQCGVVFAKFQQRYAVATLAFPNVASSNLAFNVSAIDRDIHA